MRTIIGYLGIFIWSVFCISCSVFGYIFTMSKETPVAMARTWWAPGILFFLGVKKFKITGLENIPQNEPVIIISNHSSFADIPAIFRAMPFNVRFVAKKSLKAAPFLGWYMTMTDMIFIDRGNKKRAAESMAMAGEMIREGRSVIVFAEGTRTKTGELGQFKKGAFHLAQSAQVKILPVAIKGSFNIWSSLSLKLTPGDLELHIGEPIRPLPEINDTLQTVRKSVVDLLR